MAYRGVHEPPKSAARGIVSWAIDLWPYVNGKALFNGIKLTELEASDMVDVLHYLFEEDMNYTSGEQAEAKSKMRTSIYRTMYETTYKYGYESPESKNQRIFDEAMAEPDPVEDLKPFDPLKAPTKAFMPATDYNPNAAKPFGMDLDAPLR